MIHGWYSTHQALLVCHLNKPRGILNLTLVSFRKSKTYHIHPAYDGRT